MRHKTDVELALHPEGAAMGMSLGDSVRVTLFGESHGAAVGALLDGVPAGIPVPVERRQTVDSTSTHFTVLFSMDPLEAT